MRKIYIFLVALLAIAAAATEPARAQSTSSLEFMAKCNGSGTANDGVQWTVTSDGAENQFDNTKGIHYGTNSAQVQYIELSTSGIEGTITQVKVNASTASNVTATVGVTVGGNAFGGDPQSLSSTATDYTFTGSASGEIVVRVAKPSAATKALYVKSIEVTYTQASSGGGSTPEPPAPGQNSTTYNVTFGGFSNPVINTTVSVTSLPQTFTAVGSYDFNPWQVLSGDAAEFTGVSVTSGGEGKVSANIPDWMHMTITVTGTFEGTATIHVDGNDDEENPISRDITVSCVAAPVPITVRMAEGTEDAANWTLASGNASVPGNQVLENVMSGSQVTATYNGTTKKVKSVKAVKYVEAPAVSYITVAGLQLIGQDGDSWQTLAANNPDKIELASGQVYRLSDEAILMDGECGGASTNPVSSSTTYNASSADEYHWCE